MIGVLAQLLKRSAASRFFILSILCALLAHVLNLSASLGQIIAGNYEDVIYAFDYSLGAGSFTELLVLAPAIVGGLLFWEEAENKAYILMLIRSKRWKYIASHIAACMILSAFCMIAAQLIVWFSLSIFLPFVTPDAGRLLDLQNDFHGYLWQSGSIVPYILFYSFLAGMNGMLWGTFSMTISTFTRNPFVILFCPLIAYQGLNIFYSLTNASNSIRLDHLICGYFVLGTTASQELLKLLVIFGLYLLPCIILTAMRIWRTVYEK